jgi:hypothetical protein
MHWVILKLKIFYNLTPKKNVSPLKQTGAILLENLIQDTYKYVKNNIET